jgi:hypothetical protein
MQTSAGQSSTVRTSRTLVGGEAKGSGRPLFAISIRDKCVRTFQILLDGVLRRRSCSCHIACAPLVQHSLSAECPAAIRHPLFAKSSTTGATKFTKTSYSAHRNLCRRLLVTVRVPLTAPVTSSIRSVAEPLALAKLHAGTFARVALKVRVAALADPAKRVTVAKHERSPRIEKRILGR